METVNERSYCLVTVSFLDEDLVAVVPTAATYRIDDIDSGTNILEETAITGLASSVQLLITDEQNRIINSDRKYEIREIDVSFTYLLGARKGTASYQYQVKNLFGLT